MKRAAGLVALPALLALAGCAAAAIAPIVAGGLVAKSSTDARAKKHALRAATPVPAAALAAAQPQVTGATDAARPLEVRSDAGVLLTGLTELPAPSSTDRAIGAGAGDAWAEFVAYAVGRAARMSEGRQRSALLAPGTSLVIPAQRDCATREPAVIVDLDPGSGAFSPRDGAATAEGVADGLARLRAAGVAVVWISQNPAAQVGSVARALRDAGLDPEGRDPLLLVRGPDDRKQSLREEANRDVCVIALAGDRREDFDELFDYLRDPASASGLDSMLGAGWFLVPPPLG